jgi:capsular exopolysaccharide synthesis family protein
MSIDSTHPVIEEIRRLYDNGQSGVLALNNSNGNHVDVFFCEGIIDAVSSNLEGRRLGDYLIKHGYAQSRDIDAAYAVAQRQKILIGEAMVVKKAAAQPEIALMVRQQAVELLDCVFEKDFTVDSFTPLLRTYYAPARISVQHVMLEVYRSTAEPINVAPETRISLVEGIDLLGYPWYPEEMAVLDELRQPVALQDLWKTTGLKRGNLHKILGVLNKLGIIIASSSGFSEALVHAGKLDKMSAFLLTDLIPVVTNATPNQKLQEARNESSFTSEQFRNLKVQIRDISTAVPLKVFTVSSPEAKDGKSLVSAALAFSFAKDPGRRVIIVDCDLRKPSLDDYLGVTSEPGLLQYLASTHMSPYCYVRRMENLFFMTTGGVAPNPIEILSLNKMQQLIQQLKKDFDTIVLDAPPYAPIADARIVTSLSDGLIMVLRRGKTSYTSTDRAFKAVDRNKLLGVVFNDVQPSLFQSQQDMGYYYGGANRPVYATRLKFRNNPKKYLES